jgi:hypothetical protein
MERETYMDLDYRPEGGIWLNVPYRDKDEAKALGAWFDWNARRWYLPEETFYYIGLNAVDEWLSLVERKKLSAKEAKAKRFGEKKKVKGQAKSSRKKKPVRILANIPRRAGRVNSPKGHLTLVWINPDKSAVKGKLDGVV